MSEKGIRGHGVSSRVKESTPCPPSCYGGNTMSFNASEGISTCWFGGPDAEGRGREYPAYAKIYRLARLPGQGTRPDYCGETRWMVCNSCAKGSYGFEAARRCFTRDCPDCYERWAFKEARIASWRVWAGARYVSRAIAKRYFRIVHAVVSFKVEGETTLKTYRDMAYRVVRKHGIQGGAMVWHPFRKDEVSGLFVSDGYVHFHVVGAAWGNIEAGSSGAGYFFKVIRDAVHGDYRGFRSPGEVLRAMAYLLSHCGVVDGVHAVTWFGVLSYNKLALARLREAFPEGYEEMTRKRGVACPYCGSEDTEPMDTWEFDGMSMRWEFRERSRTLRNPVFNPLCRVSHGIDHEGATLERFE